MELVVGQPLDVAASLESGQAHRWRREGDWFSGVVRGNFIKIRQTPPYPPLGQGGTTGGVKLEFRSQPSPEASVAPLLQSYFRLDDDINAIYAEISRDERVAAMVARYPGLRVLRQEPWECLIAFICSANNNIPRIHQNMETLADRYGTPIKMDGQVRHAFPTPAQLAEAGETELRELRLGFRAPYVAQAARRVAEARLDLEALVRCSYPEAKVRLMECPGVGSKIADCVAVFSLEKLEAFPIDVWVRRALGEWYFPGQKTPTDRVLLEWAQDHFGRYAGYANQYLFHGRRLER
jgi:N-glycosylase/DNA lyase